MTISLDKITYTRAVGRYQWLDVVGRPVKISDQHVWILARTLTGSRTGHEYPAPPQPVKVDRAGCFLYR